MPSQNNSEVKRTPVSAALPGDCPTAADSTCVVVAELMIQYIQRAEDMLDIVLSSDAAPNEISQADHNLAIFCDTLAKLVEVREPRFISLRAAPCMPGFPASVSNASRHRRRHLFPFAGPTKTCAFRSGAPTTLPLRTSTSLSASSRRSWHSLPGKRGGPTSRCAVACKAVLCHRPKLHAAAAAQRLWRTSRQHAGCPLAASQVSCRRAVLPSLLELPLQRRSFTPLCPFSVPSLSRRKWACALSSCSVSSTPSCSAGAPTSARRRAGASRPAPSCCLCHNSTHNPELCPGTRRCRSSTLRSRDSSSSSGAAQR